MGNSIKGMLPSPACMKNRLLAHDALKTLENVSYAASSGTASTAGPRFAFQLGRYGTPQTLSGSRLKLTGPTSGDAKTIATAILNAHKDLLGLGPDDTFGRVSVLPSKNGSVVHLHQYHMGVPVFGAHVVVDLDPSGAVRSLFNSTVPDITQSPAATVAGTTAVSTLATKHSVIPGTTSTSLAYRPARSGCDPADLAWRVTFDTTAGPREAWVAATTGSVLVDASRVTELGQGRVGVTVQDCQSWFYDPIRACSIAPCTGLTGDTLSVCVWAKDLWDYWADAGIHGATTRFSYDNHSDTCLTTQLDCGEGGSGYAPCQLGANYVTKGVQAHEFGHGVIANACAKREPVLCDMDLLPGQQRPVYEHIADMQAMAVDSVWNVHRASGEKIRDWALPSSVTVYNSYPGHPGPLYTRFPDTFDDLNSHGMFNGNRPDTYVKWHVGSTVWSHLVYNLAQIPALGRTGATEIVYRTLVNRMEVDDDFSFTGYAHHMLLEADGMGAGYEVLQAQHNAKLWMPSESVLFSCYGRPGIVGGYDLHPIGGGGYYATAALYVYYDQYVPGGSDLLIEGKRDDTTGAWTYTDTGLSPSWVGGGISAAFDEPGHQYFIAFRGWDGSIRYARRSAFLNWTWDPVQAVPGVSTQHDVSLVAGNGQVRIYFRDSASGHLCAVRWTGSSWAAPVCQPGRNPPVLTAGPSASWDGSRFQVMYLANDASQQASHTLHIAQVAPSSSGDVWHELDTLDGCYFDDRVEQHQWHNTPAGQVMNGKLYTMGPWVPSDQDPSLMQTLGTHPPSSSHWQFNDHGGLDRMAHATDLTAHDGKLFAVGYLAWPYHVASIFWKAP